MLIEIGKSLIVDVLWCSYVFCAVCLGILNTMMHVAVVRKVFVFERCSRYFSRGDLPGVVTY